MSVADEAGIILRKVGKGLLSIVIPFQKVNEPSEYLVLHYCKKCQKYHRAGTDLETLNQKKTDRRKPDEYPGMHYCEKCGRQHRV